MKLLFIADIHIKLGQKKVPRDWQKARILQLAEEVNSAVTAHDVNHVVIGGDLLDVANPSYDEIGLMFEFLSDIEAQKVLIAGNHEMANKTTSIYSKMVPLLGATDTDLIEEFTTLYGVDYIPYGVLNKKWPETNSKLAITHVRGEIPPHVQPEIELEVFNRYEKVFAGDLHSFTNSQRNILYPGSPFSTSFHRNVPHGANGYFIIDTSDGSHAWHELLLPQLIRKTVQTEDEIVETDFHHTIYELEGEMEDLAKVSNKLIDKKVTKDISTPASLTLDGDIKQELDEYLREVQNIDETSAYITAYMEVVGSNDTD